MEFTDSEIDVAHGQCEDLVARLSRATGLDWTFGYVGNIENWGDTRLWSAFAPHPGRVGTSDDCLGQVPTKHLPILVGVLMGAWKLTKVLAVPGRHDDSEMEVST